MGTKAISRVVIDDRCDGCDHARGRAGVVFAPGGPVLCWWCLHRAATAFGYRVDLPGGLPKETAPAAQGAAAGAGGGAGAGVHEGSDATEQVYCGICVRAVADGRCPSCDTAWPHPLTEPEARVFQRAWGAHDDDDSRAGAAWLAVENYRRQRG